MPGVNVMIFKLFSQKIGDKIGVLTQITAIYVGRQK
jgi:hypothetical protein